MSAGDKAVHAESRIIGCNPPPLVEIYMARLQKEGPFKDYSHSANSPFNLPLLREKKTKN